MMVHQFNSDTLPGPSIHSKRYSEVHLEKTKRRSGTKGEKGVLFEKKILMLVLYRACEEGLDFKLDTNVPGYGAFDDIVFICRENDRNNEHHIYGQLKHKESENKKITFEDLLKSSGDFSLYKYFIDYINILKNHKEGEKHFIIYTNADFHCPGQDEEGYRIHKKTDDEYFVFKVLDTSNCKPLAVFDTGQLKSSTNFMKKQEKNPTFYQFSDNTVNGLGEIDRVKLMLKDTFLTNDKKEKKLQVCEEELDIILENFLKAFVFAIDQYDEITLGNLIREKMRQSHPDYQVHYVFLYALDEIGLWKNRNAPPLTEKDNFFKKGIEESDNYRSLYPVLNYERELSCSNIRFTQQVYENLKDFITSRRQLWHITSDSPWLNSLLIHQALNQKALYEYSKINYSSHDHHILLTWNQLIEGYPFLLSLFENMKESILVIACTSNDLKDGRICEMVDKIANVVSEPQKYLKQIILIAPKNCELATLTAKLSVFSHKTQEVRFDHLTKQSQDDCLTKENVRFQGNEKLVSIQQLMRVKEGYCISEEFENLNLDALELEKLLKNDVVEIGNDQPELSELESMHIKPLSIIKAGDLKRAITAHLQDIFALVATEKEIEKLLPENEKYVTFVKWLELSNMPDFCPQSKRLILLKRSNKEDEQFKQLCRLINQYCFRKFEAENTVLPVPTLHLLKEREKEWIWMQSYSRELYIHRHFSPLFINRFKLIDFMLENSLLFPVELSKNTIKISLNLLDFIIISEITHATFLDSLVINSSQVQEQIQEFVKRSTTKVNTENKSELSSKHSANQPNLKNEAFSLIFNNDYKTVFLENSDAQEEFQRLSSYCSNFSGQSVHWLKAVNDNGEIHYQWYCSAGTINRIRSVLDDERKHSVSEKCLLANNAPIIVIADEPGMGKSTTLVSMAEMWKKSNPWLWVIKIDLNQHQETLAETGVKTLEDLIALLSTIDEKLTDSLTRKILRYKLTYARDVLFLCDGFDEVKCERQGAVLSVLKIMRRVSAAKICITTRLYCKEELEENLSVLVNLFQPIDELQQIDFLSHFWQAALKLTMEKSNLSVLEEYASKVIKKFRDSILDDRNPRSFVSVPLRARMLADIYRETIENALRGNEKALNRIESREKIYIGNLYDQFILKKYEIYFHEKIIVGERFDEDLEFLMNSYTENYGVLALENIFGCKIAKHLNASKKKQFSFTKLSQIGLIQGKDTTYNFIHRTFAEYFAGRWLADACENLNAKRIICEKLLMKECKVLRYFFDYFMSEDVPLLRAVLHDEESEFSELLIQNADVRDGLRRTALHLAAQEGRVKMIDVLQKRNISLVADKTGKTPLHYAAAFDFDIEEVKRIHVDALLENLIDIDLDDHIFKSPLHFDMDIGFSIFKNSICKNSNLVKTVNKRDGAKKSSVKYAAEHQHWGTACVLVLHGADVSFLTKGQKKNLLNYAANHMHFGVYSGLNIRLRPVVGLLSIQVPESVQNLSDNYKYPRLLSYFFEHGHTKVIDSLMCSIENTERRKRIVNAKDNGASPLSRLAFNFEFIPNDEEYLKIIMYYDLQGREVLGMVFVQKDIRYLLYGAAKGGFIRSFRYLYELYLREKRVESVFCPEFLQDIIGIINDLYSNVQDLKYDDKWFQDLTSECSRLFGWSKLHFAATNKYINSIEEFLDCSIFDSLKTKDKCGYNPLLFASADRGRSKFIENLFLALKKWHLDDKDQLYEIIHTEDNWGASPLHWVIYNSDSDSAKALLSNMYDIGFDKRQLIHILTHQNANGKTPMYDIKNEKIAEYFMEYLKKFDFSPEECIDILKSSDDLLHRLICHGSSKIALALLIGIENLPLNVDQIVEVVNWPGKNNENTPLHEAADEGYCYEIVLRLFRNGAIFNACNSLGELPIDIISRALRRNKILSRLSEFDEYFLKTHFLLDSISSLFELLEDHQISQNLNKLDKLETILYEVRSQSWIDPRSILNARNREKQTLRDVNKDTVVSNLLQEYEKHYLQ